MWTLLKLKIRIKNQRALFAHHNLISHYCQNICQVCTGVFILLAAIADLSTDIPMCLAVSQKIILLLLFSEKLLLPATFVTHSNQMSHEATRLADIMSALPMYEVKLYHYRQGHTLTFQCA